MFAYQVHDMTCGHCVGTITKAVQALDGGAKVEADLNRHMIFVESTSATEPAIKQAIRGAGYEPIGVKSQSGQPSGVRNGGCCCGSGAARCGA
ncbi:MAG: heavy-metal-associated domain-containing protein [Aquabacterium sp.]